MTEATIHPIAEKVYVFVSSTIEECRAERNEAKRAIESMNHAPLLFEGAGARSYPPRTLYLRMVHMAHIFIGIYKNDYGWVAPEMTVSGIEDEFRNAMARGMPRLIYILKHDSERSDRLRILLDEIMLESGVTVAFYEEPSELYARLRNDIEAEVAKTFHDREKLEASLSTDAGTVLKAVLSDAQQFVPRPDVINAIEAGVADACPVQVYGPPGIGKTVLLAAMAAEKKSIYVAASHLSRKDVASVIATIIRQKSELPPMSYLDATQAYSDLVSVWCKADGFRVILDDCHDPTFIASLLEDVGGIQAGKSLIYSTRVSFDLPSQRKVVVPPMKDEEVRKLVTLQGRQEIGDAELQDLLDYSQGNPLYVRLYEVDKSAGLKRDLASFEMSFWESLESRSQEILAYVSMSPLPLSVGDLLSLVGATATSEIFSGIDQLRPYLRDEVLGYSLLHEHIGETVHNLLKRGTHRRAYYTKRLAKHFTRRRDAVSAFLVLDEAEDPAALRFANRAAFDAVRHGNITQALRILDRKLCAEREEGNDQEAVLTLLSMAHVKEEAGFADEALSAAENALTAAQSLADNALILRAREVRASCLIRKSLDPEALDELKGLRSIYEGGADSWSCARLDLEIGAILIRMKRYEEAETHTRTSLTLFEEIGDAYGCSLAKRNLASILSESADNDEEVRAILNGFQVATLQSGNLRERAWFCNLMVRKCRRSEEYSRAEKYGKEAIAIGEKLGDIQLVALNRICLGNVYRDEQEYDKAFSEYYQTAKDAQKAGDRSLEASTSNLIAGIHNRMGKTDLAIQYATHAIGLVRGTLATTELSNSCEELAHSYLAANRDADAAKAYIDAAYALKNSQNEEELFRLALEGLFIFVENKMIHEYLDALVALSDTEAMPAVESATTPIERLYNALWRFLPVVPRTHIIDLCGLHFRLMFDGIPLRIGRYLFKRLSRELIAQGYRFQQESWRMLFPILPLLVSVPPNALSLSDIIDLSDGLHRACSGISFKPQNDGAAHWVLDLQLQTPFLCSITQLDDGADTATAAMILTLFLKGFEQNIREEFTTSQGLAIDELAIQICNTRDLPRDIDNYFKPAVEDQVCVVTRPTDPSDRNVPTIVICREDIASRWVAGRRGGGSMQTLIGMSLNEIAYRLFGGEVDLESLRPKIVGLVRKTMS